jgi:hypothetical protein
MADHATRDGSLEVGAYCNLQIPAVKSRYKTNEGITTPSDHSLYDYD